MNYSRAHSLCLDSIVNNLYSIDENPNSARALYVEIDYFNERDVQRSMCDLVILYSDAATLVEIKRSRRGRKKALKQLRGGVNYVKDLVGSDGVIFSPKIVYYVGDGRIYTYENVDGREIGIARQATVRQAYRHSPQSRGARQCLA